jgi:hypothetical protein
VKPLFSLQLSDPEPERDDEVQPWPHAASASAATEKTPEKTATSSEEEEGEDEDDSGRVPSYGGAVAKGKRVSTGASSSDSSSSESSGYVLSTSNPTEVAEALGATNARMISGQVVASLCFESWEHERGFCPRQATPSASR